MPASDHSPNGRLTQVRALRGGLATLSPTDVIKVGGKSLTVQQYLDQLKSDEATYQAVVTAQKNYKSAKQARADIEDDCQGRCSDLTAALKVILGPDSPALVDFGIAPNKARRSATVDQKVETVAKAKATRAARHTMGSRQKAAVHGEETAGDGSTDAGAGATSPAAPAAGTSNGAG